MKSVLKFLGYALGVIVLLLVVAIGCIYGLSSRRLNQTIQVTAKPVIIPSDEAAIARGRHIAETRGCVVCHGKDYAGNIVVDNPMVGRLAGPNLTRGRGGLPATYTNEDWVRAIRHGVSREGRPYVLMPSLEFSHFSDEDLGSLIAYLKTVPAVDREPVPIRVGPLSRALILAGEIKLSAEHIDHAGLMPRQVAPGITADYGHYLASSCFGCHHDDLSGGKIPGVPPDWPHSRNLTPAGDLAKWSEADFMRALQTGTRPDGTKLNPVMPVAFGQMNDTELKALWAYIKTLPAVATAK